MGKLSLAVDIGASSGRLIAGHLEEGVLKLEEIYRFQNKIIKNQDQFCWDVDTLFMEIKKGIHECGKRGLKPDSIGIDTWAIDFVLLDEHDQPLTKAVSYRDPRTAGMMEEVFKKIEKDQLYLETGIQFLTFNTIYQLEALKRDRPEVLKRAKTFLMIPDYFNYLLTGKKSNEYTNATTTQLVNAFSKNWDAGIIDKLGINKEIFKEIMPPGTVLGNLKEELAADFGFDLEVILPATHDTGSAVVAVPEVENTIYISSGTWSLIGVENRFPICVPKASQYNYTNEGGVDYRYRFLKNIMGLWMIQEVKRNYKDQYSFSELVALAREATEFHTIINVDDGRFLKPDHMISEIQDYCTEKNLLVPETPGEIAKCIFVSLAESYQSAILEIEEIFEQEFKTINVIGGGCQNEYLNQLIADRTGKVVIAGPSEATAIGNLAAQLMSLDEIEDLKEARTIIKRSFDLKEFTPAASEVNEECAL
ncbi:rhamnulokinase [Cytobacillus oceanisediminis]|uniref:rhamnulokinase n=1 Tax=Cytobacillus oceanisediminis TaxID=665099 RepID=UPI00207A3082|nr:rhamnulokinase [Cytobacillus oceanisediminis]USK43987.1 rhamnulokinase [Cytobacillus oceanisediminis]